MRKIIIVDNCETNYEVSDDGRVFNKKTGRQLKGTYARNEYHSVQLMINGKAKSFMTHRLVAEAFCENPYHYTLVDHIDQDKYNNKASNLRWVTNKENSLNTSKRALPKEKQFVDVFVGEDWRDLLVNSDYAANKNGIIINKKTKQILQGTLRNGYIRINLQGTYFSAHLLIWEAFYGKISEDKVIDHIDGNRQNNSLSNLRIVSQKENMNNAQNNGHHGQVGVSQFSKEGKFIKHYPSLVAAAKENNGNACAIKDAANRHGASAGFLWIRDDQDITIEELLKISPSLHTIKKTFIGVSKYTKDGEFIQRYNTIAEAARSVNKSGSTIKRAADARRLCCNYYWILENDNITIKDICSANSLIAGES